MKWKESYMTTVQELKCINPIPCGNSLCVCKFPRKVQPDGHLLGRQASRYDSWFNLPKKIVTALCSPAGPSNKTVLLAIRDYHTRKLHRSTLWHAVCNRHRLQACLTASVLLIQRACPRGSKRQARRRKGSPPAPRPTRAPRSPRSPKELSDERAKVGGPQARICLRALADRRT